MAGFKTLDLHQQDNEIAGKNFNAAGNLNVL